MNGPRKAAILLLSLHEEHAVNILQQLDEDELALLRSTVEGMQPVNTDLLNTVHQDFVSAFKSGLTSVRGGRTYLRSLVGRAYGEQEASRLFEEEEIEAESDVEEGPLSALSGVDPEVLGVTLAGEHPQIAAALLAHLDPPLAAKAIEPLGMAQQSDLLLRITKLRSVPATAVSEAEKALGGLGLTGGVSGAVDGVNAAATILKRMGGTTADELLERLTEDAPDEAATVKRAMFTFENLSEVDKRGLQQLLREVQSDTLRVALKNASEDLKDKLLDCISSRAADMLREELELMGPTPLAEVETAQGQVVEIAMKLASEGRISLGEGGEQMV